MDYHHKKNMKLQSFNGLDVLPNLTLNRNYLNSIYQLMDRALSEHPRTTILRFDLHLPPCQTYQDEFFHDYGPKVITRFIESFKAQIRAEQVKKKKMGIRVHPCTVRYVWAKERDTSNQPHYHLALLLNKDAYFGFGDYRELRINLAGKLYRAWASALSYEEAEDVVSLIHIPANTPYYHLNGNASNYVHQCNEVFRRLSYLAKCDTKHYGTRSKNFSCSRV